MISTDKMTELENEIYNDIRAGANIINKDEYRMILTSLAKVAAETVSQTLGPYGSTTLVDAGDTVYPTKDGWQVLKTLHFSDVIYNKLFQVLTNVSFNSAHRVGDGTTTAMCAAYNFIHILVEYMQDEPDMRQADLLGIIEKAKDVIVAELLEAPELMKINRDGDLEDLYRVAYVASNGNEELSRMIQTLYRETENPDIYFEISPNNKTTARVDDGYRFDCRPLYLDAFRNDDSGAFKDTDSDVLVYIFDHPLNYQEHGLIISSISKLGAGKQTLIFAPHFDDIITNMINTSIRTQRQKGFVPNIMLIQYSLVTELDKGTMRDLSYMTNAQIFDYGKARAFRLMVAKQEGKEIKTTVDDNLVGTESYEYNYETTQDLLADCCGHISTLVLMDTFCIIKDYERYGDMELFEAEKQRASKTYEALKKKVEMQTSELGREYLNAQLRYIRLSGKMGSIYIGGPSITEKRYMYDVVEDVVFACKSAYENGVIRGLNLTTLSILQKLYENTEETTLRYIYGLFYDSFMDVTRQVMLNKYHSYTTTTACYVPVMEYHDMCDIQQIIDFAIENKMGFNLVTDSFESVDDGYTVINSVSTDIEIVKSMVSILATVLSSSQMVTINRMYDRGMSKMIQREAELKVLQENANAEERGRVEARAKDVGAMTF